MFDEDNENVESTGQMAGSTVETSNSTPEIANDPSNSAGVSQSHAENAASTPIDYSWDGRRETLESAPWFSELKDEVKTAILSGIDAISAQSTADLQAARDEREQVEALMSLLDAQNPNDRRLAEDLTRSQSELESLRGEKEAAAADYLKKLSELESSGAASRAELEELRAAKANFEGAQADFSAKIAELEGKLNEATSSSQQIQQDFADTMLMAYAQWFKEQRPDLAENQEAADKFFDFVLDNSGDAERAMKFVSIDFPPPPAPDPVPGALELMQSGEPRTLERSLKTNGAQDGRSAMERLRQRVHDMEVEADREHRSYWERS